MILFTSFGKNIFSRERERRGKKPSWLNQDTSDIETLDFLLFSVHPYSLKARPESRCVLASLQLKAFENLCLFIYYSSEKRKVSTPPFVYSPYPPPNTQRRKMTRLLFCETLIMRTLEGQQTILHLQGRYWLFPGGLDGLEWWWW